MGNPTILAACLTVLAFSGLCTGLVTRCFVCNSRGELGDCKDPFLHNGTSFRQLPGNPINTASCPSGWCRKQMDIVKGKEAYGVATVRQCLLNGPSDGEERCAKVMLQNKPTLICFCRGDLCNSAQRLQLTASHLALLAISMSLIFQTANAFL